MEHIILFFRINKKYLELQLRKYFIFSKIDFLFSIFLNNIVLIIILNIKNCINFFFKN